MTQQNFITSSLRWTMKLFIKGSKRGLTMDDIWPPMASDESEQLTNKLETNWNEELRQCTEKNKIRQENTAKKYKPLKPSLTKAIFKTFWLRYFIIGIFSLIQTAVLRNFQPIFQSLVVEYFNENDNNPMTQNEVLGYAAGLVVITFAATFILHHAFLDSQQIGMRVRVACSSLIYRKSLKLSKASLDNTAAGQVVNLIGNDVLRFDLIFLYLNYIWIMPIQLVVVGYIMWQSIRIYSLVALGSLIILTIPVQTYLSKISGNLRALIARLTDRRVQLMSELIAGIQVVKMYAWEKPFSKIVSQTRKLEMDKIHKSSNIRGFYTSLFVITERFTLFLTVVSFIAAGNSMTADIVFQLSSYFNILQMVMAIFFPLAIILAREAWISIKRIEEFLLLDEIKKTIEDPKKVIKSIKPYQLKSANTTTSNAVYIELNRVSANWISGQLPATLNDVSLKIKKGELCGLVGPVGSGKSSLLNLLLQELPVGSGVVGLFQHSNEQDIDLQSKRGFFQDNSGLKISYASQDPWLFTATVRENILFGQDYDQVRYQEVTKACSLIRDLKQFPNGDMTIVGERGASLSGGQRARINLARAIYRQADVYLLDDPLSAVDAKVARRLFKDCILKYLSGKTRIVATHQIHHLKKADIIAVMDRGMIRAQGNFEILTKTSVEFNDMLNRLKDEEKDDEDVEVNEFNDKEQFQEKNYFFRRISTRNSRVSVRSQDSYQFMTFEESSKAEQEAQDSIESEPMETGKISNKVYFKYFRSGESVISLICFISIYVISQVATSGADYWLTYWTNLESIKTCLNNSQRACKYTKSQYDALVNTPLFTSLPFLDEKGYLHTTHAIYIYTVCIVTCIISIIWRSLYFMRICTNASQNLHDNMFINILQTTMYFFNTNPSGRILNRFSKDTGTMDEILSRAMLEGVQIFAVMTGILILIIVVNVWMIIPILIIGIFFFISRDYYLRTAQDIKRLEGIAKSPVFSHITATLNGLTTVRSSGHEVEVMLRKRFDQFQDAHSGAWYLLIATSTAFGFAVDIVSCIFVCCVCFSLISIGPENMTGAAVGLAISQALILTGMVQYGVKQSTEVQAQMTSVERILEYTNLPKEDSGNTQPAPESWPSEGRIEFKSVFLSYKKDDPAVLKDINLVIESGWKVGVVGRTGAGKSSLITALFRLANDGLVGKIIIDGVDTKDINLDDLRSNLSIIPQEPVLFSETLRYNLDPFGKYTDDVIWDALKEVELSDLILDQKVTEGGTNFSVGQRQLICLARALLRNNKILVLDEATANIDSRTDALIQRAIRSKFSNYTVITVAHRLNTIIDSDRVLVMDDGRVKEFDSPYNLIYKKKNSLFCQMIEQTGSVMAEKLCKEAAMHHRQKIQSQNNLNEAITSDIIQDDHEDLDGTIESSIQL
ncbi:multidrug resistance-associated protein 4-like isoform X2 [Chelonus insularis]|uniref:multidrug resistance-associated protein 4-like isoform X2 n=1 Tax=Chelonus insularis TaxID=460826 RepID=UPI00158DC71C|nr:multidrug resistance-associated protein 4-like isoform X2 [Chelonus insularis]